jgi:hypothetical protein
MSEAVLAALKKVEMETGIQPSEVDVRIEMISSGPQFDGREEHYLGEVSIDFKV